MPEPCVTPQPPLTVVPSAILGYLRNSTKKKPEIFKNPSKRPSNCCTGRHSRLSSELNEKETGDLQKSVQTPH